MIMNYEGKGQEGACLLWFLMQLHIYLCVLHNYNLFDYIPLKGNINLLSPSLYNVSISIFDASYHCVLHNYIRFDEMMALFICKYILYRLLPPILPFFSIYFHPCTKKQKTKKSWIGPHTKDIYTYAFQPLVLTLERWRPARESYWYDSRMKNPWTWVSTRSKMPHANYNVSEFELGLNLAIIKQFNYKNTKWK